MKRYSIILGILMLTVAGYCQKVKLVKKLFPGSKIISESYYVLKSDNRIKHGEYTAFFKSTITYICNGDTVENSIRQHGFFVKGKKDGPWIERDGRNREERGNYSNGKRVGIWDTYHYCFKKGSYDYSLGRKIGTWIYPGENGLTSHNYETGEIEVESALSSFTFRIHYPRKAVEENIQGIVRFQLKITTDCHYEISIIQSLSKECDEAVVNAIKEGIESKLKRLKVCEEYTFTQDVKFSLVEG